MGTYIIRRLLLVIPTLIIVSVMVFGLIRLIPGNVVDQMLLEHRVDDPAERAEIEHELGLDVPVLVQYGRWLGDIFVHGSLGETLWTGIPVTERIFQSLPVSLELGSLAFIISMLIALPVGVFSAVKQDTIGDYIARTVAIACIALPSFWLATMVMVFPPIWWGWSPPMQFVPFLEDPAENLKMIILPAVILGMLLSGTTMRMTRTMVLEVLKQDYVRTAWAKGLKERVILVRHVLKNAMIPVVTTIGLQIPLMVGGAIIQENIFVLPGMGMLTVESIFKRDYTLLSGINIFVATMILFANVGIDLTYAYLDPRIHYR